MFTAGESQPKYQRERGDQFYNDIARMTVPRWACRTFYIYWKNDISEISSQIIRVGFFTAGGLKLPFTLALDLKCIFWTFF